MRTNERNSAPHRGSLSAWRFLRLMPPLLVAALLLVAFRVEAQPLRPTVVADHGDRVVLRYSLPAVELRPVTISGVDYQRVTLAGARAAKDWVGAPELPRLTDSVLVPDEGQIEVRVLEQRSHVVQGVDVAPSKGILLRTVDPASVPHSFGPQYALDEPFPAANARLRAPYVMRDFRAVVVELYPVQANPVRRTLTVLDEITIEIARVAPGGQGVLTRRPRRGSEAFRSIYRHHFVNYTTRRYDPPIEEGGMLLIVHDAWLPNVQPFVEHKNSIGIATEAVGVSTIGTEPAAIKAAIQSLYDTGELAFVLLVGDAEQVPPPMAHEGAADPSYAQLAGDDAYPDVLIGRFSAQSAQDVDTQVARTIQYELAPATAQEWFKRSTGIGSAEGPGDDGQLDYEHIAAIREVLLDYDYTEVDALYEPSASAAAVGSALDGGRGLVNYCGHGSMDSWTTSGFSNADIQSLDNAGMLPFIISVACVNGAFHEGTCFGESWLRATRDGEPIGAVGAYMSSINQSWDPPMAAQDEAARLLSLESTFTLGGLAFAGSGQMLDEYGDAGVEMFDTWILFGDPSLRIFGQVKPPSGIAVKPFKGLAATGAPGGPFEPSELVYTVHNYSETAVELEVRAAMPWLSVTPAAATIEPDAETSVTVTIEPMAAALDVGAYGDAVAFINLTDHDGDAERAVSLTVGEPSTQMQWPLDEDPGWTVEGAWAFGPPTGGGGEHGAPDPTSGHTGENVYGYNLDGDYSGPISEHHLTAGPLDCSELRHVSLAFWRWLGVETSEFDRASVSVSTDGESWTPVWQNSQEIADSRWEKQEIDLSRHADGQSTVYLRWTMGPTDEMWNYCGWNIDDIELRGLPSGGCWDVDQDGSPDSLCGGDDCDDSDADVSPAEDENCTNGVDDDCDGLADAADPACAGVGGSGGGSGGAAGGPFPTPDDDGCGCRLPGSPSPRRAPSPLALLGLLGLAARRGRHNRSCRTPRA